MIQNDSRIKLLQLEKNSGTGIARNKGVSNAKGGYISFLDADDLWAPSKLKKQIDFLINNDVPFTFFMIA
jgi:glycosyltransferase involved in cell wall biosynthesis